MLLHDQIIEVPPRVDCTFLVEPTLLHEVTYLVNEALSHLEKLLAAHLMVSIGQVCGSVRQASSLEETQDELGIPTVLHTHQTLVID